MKGDGIVGKTGSQQLLQTVSTIRHLYIRSISSVSVL